MARADSRDVVARRDDEAANAGSTPQGEACGSREHDREQDHRYISTRGLQAGNRRLARERRDDEPRRPSREHQAQRGTRRGEHQALSDQLAQQPAAPGSEGRANGQLLRARGVACEHQVDDVRRGDEQDDTGDAEEDEEPGPRRSGDRVEEWHDVHADPGVGPRECRGNAGGDGSELRLGRLARHSGAQSADDAKVPVTAARIGGSYWIAIGRDERRDEPPNTLLNL